MSYSDIWIVEECSNPSTEYYILPALKILGFEERVRILNFPPIEGFFDSIIIIFVRYLNDDWVNFIERNRKKIKKILYFMDDDLFDLKSWKNLPFRYIKKIYQKAFKWKRWLFKVDANFLVSTEFLAEKYKSLNPAIVPPYPIFDASVINESNEEDIVVFYHGTASHKKEIYWLYDIVKATVSKNEKVLFELIGDDKIYNKFKSLERVIVVHPMRWNLYKRFLIKRRRHIGLAPILGNNFNRARSYIKFFEITSCGAVGVYSIESCYKKVVSDGVDGILLSNDKIKWIEAILKLSEDSAYRSELYLNLISKIKTLKEFAEQNYRENLIWRLK